jgi:hypothetical protein
MRTCRELVRPQNVMNVHLKWAVRVINPAAVLQMRFLSYICHDSSAFFALNGPVTGCTGSINDARQPLSHHYHAP